MIRRAFLLIIGLILFLATHAAEGQQIRYVYDDLGRLIAVMDQQGNIAIYEYDVVGNILSIRRPDTTGPVAITLFDPTQGPIGTRVEIFGIGFSDVPTENTIAFNGVPAPVLTASLTSLTTEVPTGATTGPITVTTPLGSAVSAEPFTVLGEITVSPSEALMLFGTSRQFTATLTALPNAEVLWSVNEVEGGDAIVGTISLEGLYTAPATVPVPSTVTIRATSVLFPEIFGEAMVTIVQEPTDFAEAAVSVRFGPPPPGNVSGAPASVLFGPPPPGTTVSSPVSVEFGPPPEGTIVSSGISVANAPVITSVTPDNAPQGTTLNITLTGANFTGATGVVFSFQGGTDIQVTPTNVTVISADQLTADVTIASAATVGPRVVVVQTATGSSTGADTGSNVFEVTE